MPSEENREKRNNEMRKRRRSALRRMGVLNAVRYANGGAFPRKFKIGTRVYGALSRPLSEIAWQCATKNRRRFARRKRATLSRSRSPEPNALSGPPFVAVEYRFRRPDTVSVEACATVTIGNIYISGKNQILHGLEGTRR